MLIQRTGSSSCRGWENNNSNLVEWEGTFRDYIKSIIGDRYGCETEEELNNLMTPVKSGEFGMKWLNDTSCGFDEDEYNEQYEVFEPTQDLIDMLQRNVKK